MEGNQKLCILPKTTKSCRIHPHGTGRAAAAARQYNVPHHVNHSPASLLCRSWFLRKLKLPKISNRSFSLLNSHDTDAVVKLGFFIKLHFFSAILLHVYKLQLQLSVVFQDILKVKGQMIYLFFYVKACCTLWLSSFCLPEV